MGEDCVAIGEWNRTVDEGPMSTFIANGMVRYGDEPRQHDLEPSRPGGRHVDYLVHNHNTSIGHRQAVRGIADHQCVPGSLGPDSATHSTGVARCSAETAAYRRTEQVGHVDPEHGSELGESQEMGARGRCKRRGLEPVTAFSC